LNLFDRSVLFFNKIFRHSPFSKFYGCQRHFSFILLLLDLCNPCELLSTIVSFTASIATLLISIFFFTLHYNFLCKIINFYKPTKFFTPEPCTHSSDFWPQNLKYLVCLARRTRFFRCVRLLSCFYRQPKGCP
jgi:hypothetical protein